MGLLRRNKVEMKPCRRCSQLLAPTAEICDMCGSTTPFAADETSAYADTREERVVERTPEPVEARRV